VTPIVAFFSLTLKLDPELLESTNFIMLLGAAAYLLCPLIFVSTTQVLKWILLDFFLRQGLADPPGIDRSVRSVLTRAPLLLLASLRISLGSFP